MTTHSRPALSALLASLCLAAVAAAAEEPVPAPAPAADASAAGGAPAGDPAAAAPKPADEAFEAYVAATKADEVRVRAGPGANFRVLERLPKGAWVVVTGADGEFLRVRISGGVPVYVHPDLVEVAKDGKTGVVAKSDVLMRPTPGQEYFPLEGQKLQKGDEIAVLGREAGEKGEWLKVLPPARVEYYVHASLVERVAAEGERAEDLARIALERRDAYTGGKEAEAAREAAKAREAAYARTVADASGALAGSPAEALPTDAAAQRDRLVQVMTESGDPATRARAARVSQDYATREKAAAVAKARSEKESVAGDLDRRLAEIEADYRKRMDQVLAAAPRPVQPRWKSVGTVRKTFSGYELVKGAVVLKEIDSLRYRLDDFVGLRVGVNGKEIPVDPSQGVVLFRVDGLEILE
jgi:hypothetical protein